MQSATVGCGNGLRGEPAELALDVIYPGGFGIRSQLGDLEELRNSILQHGLLNPITVRKIRPSHYEVVVGHRRLKAIESLGLLKIPVRIVEADDKESYEIFLVENLQHQSLEPLDEARALYKYVCSKERRGLGYGSVKELARRIGKSQEYVSNRIGLLRLRKSTLRHLLEERRLTVSHVEELASISDNPEAVEQLSNLMMEKQISVRVLEKTIRLIKSGLGTSRALELARIESDFRIGPELPNSSANCLDDLMRRTKRILEATLSYLDNTQPELENEPAIYNYWVKNVRLPVHRAIDGTIVCKKRLVSKCMSGSEIMPARTHLSA
jgi:ParB family chromosome partitioning protein